MFKEYSMIQTYLYLEILFTSLSLRLFITKYGIEPIRIIVREVIRKYADSWWVLSQITKISRPWFCHIM